MYINKICIDKFLIILLIILDVNFKCDERIKIVTDCQSLTSPYISET